MASKGLYRIAVLSTVATLAVIKINGVVRGRFKAGDEAIVDGEVLEALNNSSVTWKGLEVIERPSSDDEAGDEPAGDEPQLVDLLDLSIPALIEKLEGLSREELEALKAAEAAGKTRAGALEAIDAALTKIDQA